MSNLYIDMITENLKKMSEDELRTRIFHLSEAKKELNLFVPELFNMIKTAATNLSELEDKMWLLEGDPEQSECFDAVCLLYKDAVIAEAEAEKKYARFVLEMSSITIESDIALSIIGDLKQGSKRDEFNALCRSDKVWLDMTTIN